MLVPILVDAIAMGVVYLYGSIGETIIEKGGNLNLGIPGIMSLGALGGVVGVNVYFSLFLSENVIWILLMLLSIFFAFLFAALGGLIYAVLTVVFQANQNVSGLALTTFGVGLMKFIGTIIETNPLTKTRLVTASKVIRKLFTNYEAWGSFGKIFLSHGFLVYFSFIIAILVSIFLNKTKKGLYLRSIGESPKTADTQGINVTLYKFMAIIIGSGIAGLAGLYYVIDKSGGKTFVNAAIETFGWMSVALVIFSMWKPLVGIFGSIVFGGLSILQSYINVPNTQLKLFGILPYVVTVLVLIITSIVNNKNNQPPKSLGVNYYREDR